MVRLPELNDKYIKQQRYFFLFETSLCGPQDFMSYIFVNPVKIIKVRNFSEIEPAFTEIEKYSRTHYLAGYFSYELGYYFERESLRTKNVFEYPLIHLCVFDKRLYFNHRNGSTNIKNNIFSIQGKGSGFCVNNLKLNISENEYTRKILKIKERIRQGDTYQVNFTAKYNFKFSGSALSLYNSLRQRQNVPYGAFCKLGDEHIISLSPELFLKRDGQKICSQPMKGTIKRGVNSEEDEANIARLKESAKDRAENLMVVDLIRNDLGRISKNKSVRVSKLFNIIKYSTLFQMTSDVSSVLRKEVTYLDIFKSIFPGGSVTGAPKISTMQIIKKLEKSPRRIYCGALGIISPEKKAVFNLPIRTISISNHKGEMGVGSGIVSDSVPKDEFAECVLKGIFLTSAEKEFKLLETLLWDGSYKFLPEHLSRLKKSAAYFDFSCNFRTLVLALGKEKISFKHKAKYRVRLLLGKDGRIDIESAKINTIKFTQIQRVVVSRHRVDPDNAFLYHKTTNRQLYEREYANYHTKGYRDVLFLNKRNEFTEGAISNIIIQKDQCYYTPALSSGLLPGIYRGYLLKRGGLKEKALFEKDLRKADKVFICNSVRGLIPVKIDWR